MENTDYFKDRNETNILKVRELRRNLPSFCGEFFMGIEPYTTPLTRLGYARDLKIFFDFLVTDVNEFFDRDVISLTLDDLNKVTASHLEMFLEYISFYKMNGKTFRNGERARARKLSSVRALLRYFFKKDKLTSNVAAKIDTPKLHEKEIIRLEVDEVVKILNASEDGDGLSPRERSFHKHEKERDFAMLSLFLGTGIRISECVGLNIEDFDFSQNAFKVTRKGGNQVVLYFNDEVHNALQQYLDIREDLDNNQKLHPLFLSSRNERMGVRAVEKLVKKYSKIASPLKHITPHKLRSTFGTNLYRETGDIYMVAEVLGHKDVNTTRKHYAAISEDLRRNAANKVKLRKED